MVRRALLLTACLFLLPFAAHGADRQTHLANQPGAWALQFGVGNHFSLTTFEGSVFSLRKQSDPGHAWRVDLSLGASYEESDRDVDRSYEVRAQTSDSRSSGVSISFVRIWIPSPERRVRFFWGVGPSAGNSDTESNSQEDVSVTTPDNAYSYTLTQDYDSRTVSVGVRALYGVEWPIRGNISLFAEHRMGLDYEHTSSSRDVTNSYDYHQTTVIEDRSSIRMQALGVRLGLAAWF